MYAAVGPGRFAFTSSILDQFLSCKHEGTVVGGPAGPGRFASNSYFIFCT